MTGVPAGTIPASAIPADSIPASAIPTIAGIPTGTVPIRPLTSTMTLQPDQTTPPGEVGGSEDVLWLIGGGMLALLALGFILTRRSRQRTSEPVLDPDRSDKRDDEFVEPLL